MSASHDIGQLLDHWLKLTQAEAATILSADWPALQKIQAAKAGLRTTLDHAKRDGKLGHANTGLQARVARLVSLEARNAALLAAQISRARVEQSAIDQSHRTLRKIQRSYTVPLSPTAWQCYS